MAKILLRCQPQKVVAKPPPHCQPGSRAAKVGQRVPMIDLDPQGNATMGSGVDKRKLALTAYDVRWNQPQSARRL
jgi:chromosome partitioning protein